MKSKNTLSPIQFSDEEPPFEWELHSSRGLHTIETIAYNDDTISKDIIDIYVLA